MGYYKIPLSGSNITTNLNKVPNLEIQISSLNANKQNKLTAGNNITIENNVISTTTDQEYNPISINAQSGIAVASAVFTKQNSTDNNLITTSKTIVGAINELGTIYVTEQGVSGGWIYRKWNNGTCELCNIFSITPTGWKSWGTLYESNTFLSRQTIPIGFGDPPIVYASASSVSYGCMLETQGVPRLVDEANNSTIYETPEYYVVRPNSEVSGDKTFQISIYVLGYLPQN